MSLLLQRTASRHDFIQFIGEDASNFLDLPSRSAEKRQEAVQRHHLEEMTGSDLTKLPGLDLLAVQRILSEIGLDMSRRPSEKHFCAWLNVAPNNRISGGKILSSKPRKNANRAAE